jgi:hypothetical protein
MVTEGTAGFWHKKDLQRPEGKAAMGLAVLVLAEKLLVGQ